MIGLMVSSFFGLVLICISLMSINACADSASDGAKPSRKLIEFGWDEPGTDFMREHISQMEGYEVYPKSCTSSACVYRVLRDSY